MKNYLKHLVDDFPAPKLVLGIQCLLIIIVFHQIIFSPTQYVFTDSYDGAKNYFTYYSYLDQDKADLLKFENMNYPYGDYVFYTDNTPLISVPMRALTMITGNGSLTFAIFNYLTLLGILLSTFFLHRILRNFLTVPWLIFALCICLPWINPQINRISGHMNLSFSWIILAAFYLLIRLREHISDRKKTGITALKLVLLILVAALCHLYYLMIISFLIGGFCFFWGLSQLKKMGKMVSIWLLGLGIPLVGCALMFLLVRSVDTYYSLRAAAGGYNYRLWNLNFDSLYTGYDFLSAPFFLQASKPISFESLSYLGGFALYGVLIFLVLFFFIKRNVSKTSNERKRLVRLLFYPSLLCLVISLGEYARLFNGTVSFDNWASPFYFLSKMSDSFTQFRCMARFSWPFFWGLNFMIAFFLDRYYRANEGKGFCEYMLVGMLILLFVDTADRMHHESISQVKNPFTDTTALAPIRELTKGIAFSEYQAILPIPYYHVGSEDQKYTKDPDDEWCTTTYQLSLETGLPLMSSKMSRTAWTQARDLHTIFSEEGPNTLLSNRLGAQPILIFYSADPEDHFETLDNATYLKLKEWDAKEIARNGDWSLLRLEALDRKR